MRGVLARHELAELRQLGGNLARVTPEAPLFRAVVATQASAEIAKRWPGMRPVRIVCFDKTTTSNWSLPWHQDRVIAVNQKADLPGFHNWTRKGGIWHCEPPEDVLRGMLFVRFHLDDCDASTGAMEVALGSDSAGLVAGPDAEAHALRHKTRVTTARAGDVLSLPMLTLHRSLPSGSRASRRVLRIDYASAPLPPPLNWASA